MAVPPTSVLLVDYEWCIRILRNNKTWEIRGARCHKIGQRIGIACTAKTSPTGQSLVLGEVTFNDCFMVAEKQLGFVAPPQSCPENYLFLPEHLHKHQISSVADFPVLATYDEVFAWEFKDAVEYEKPVVLPSKPGRIVWARLGP